MTEQQHAIIAGVLASVTFVLLIPAAIAENGTLAWLGLLAGGVTLGFIIGCDPR